MPRLSVQWKPRFHNFAVYDALSNTSRPAMMTRSAFERVLPGCVSLAADAINAPSQIFEIPATVGRAHLGR